MKAFLLSLLLLTAALTQSQAARLVYLGGMGHPTVETSNYLPMPDGFVCQIGSFANGFDVAANASSSSLLSQNWNLLSETPIQVINDFNGSFVGECISDMSGFTGEKIYLLLFRTSDSAVPSADWSNVLEYGIYSSSKSTWVFPASGQEPGANTLMIDTSEVDEVHYGERDEDTLRTALASGLTAAQLALLNWQDQSFHYSDGAELRALEADPDGDGLNNLLEYALYTDPNAKDAAMQTFGDVENEGQPDEKHYVCAIYNVRKGANVIAERSTDFTNWFQDLTTEVISSDAEKDTLCVRYEITAAPAFIRLKASSE